MADTIHAQPIAALLDAPARAARPSFRQSCGALLDLWSFRWESRRALARLEPEQLADIGVAAGDAAQEAKKPFWRA